MVTVVENPIVNTVILHGNKKLKNDVLVALLTIHARDVLTDAKLKGDAQRIQDYYASQGRSTATVEPQVNKLPDNRVDVVFEIHEGGGPVSATSPSSATTPSATTRLRGMITSRQHNILSWLNHKDVFDEAKLETRPGNLRRFYMSRGYADFRVISVDHTFDEAKGRYYVTFTIEEGPRYRFAAINIDSSLAGVNTARLKGLIKTRQGSTFNADLVEKTIENLNIELSREGYAFAQVRPRGDRDYSTHSVAVTYLIDEGPRTYIERINVIGNTKTRDYVVRREFDVSEGDPYNRVMMDRAERKLRDLGYFKTVHISTEPGSAPDKVIVDVYVEDQSTGDISLGAGISTRGLIAEIGLNEKNFLGRGQGIGIQVGYGQKEQNYSLSFTDPYFLGSHMSFSVNAFRNQYSSFENRPFDETDQRAVGSPSGSRSPTI